MKINFFLFFSVVGLLSFSSCVHDHLVESEVKKEVKISASIMGSSGSSQVTTRVVGQDWDDGDAIGLFMKTATSTLTQPSLAENVKFVNTGTSKFSCNLNDKIYYPFNEAMVDFISYYPYNKNLNNLIYEVDVSNQENLESIDLLYSDNVKDAKSTNDSIGLSFEYQLPKLSFEIVANNSGKDLANLTAKITNLNTKATFSLADGVMSKSFEPKEVSLNVSESGFLAEAVVLPQDNLTETELILTIDTTTYTYPIKNSLNTTSFDKATSYDFSITLNAGQGPMITGVTATIKKRISKKEDIIITEDSANPSGSDGSVEDDVTEDPLKGDGSKDNPYSIAEIKELEVGAKKIWVKGYIVGSYSPSVKLENYIKGTTDAHTNCFAIADEQNEVSAEMVFPIYPENSTLFLEKFNLIQNPENLNKLVTIEGDIAWVDLSHNYLGFRKICQGSIEGEFYINK